MEPPTGILDKTTCLEGFGGKKDPKWSQNGFFQFIRKINRWSFSDHFAMKLQQHKVLKLIEIIFGGPK